jgi:hypothetical protein
VTSTTAASAPSAPNETRHPANPPSSVPIGTPSTLAAATPPKISAVARGTSGSGTSRVASPPATAQNPPIAIPTSTLEPSSTG